MNEIEKILSENPIESEEKTKPINKSNKSNKLVLKNILTKKRLIIGGVILLILVGFLLLPSCECDICDICDICTHEISIDDIKTQIISKGYVELDNGELKLSPYLG